MIRMSTSIYRRVRIRVKFHLISMIKPNGSLSYFQNNIKHSSLRELILCKDSSSMIQLIIKELLKSNMNWKYTLKISIHPFIYFLELKNIERITSARIRVPMRQALSHISTLNSKNIYEILC